MASNGIMRAVGFHQLAGAWPSGKATDFESVAYVAQDGQVNGGVSVMEATITDWLFAPDRLTLEQAAFLSGWDIDTLQRIVNEGDVDTDDDGRIFTDSLEEFQESLALIRRLR